jgi:predicted transcriptional regulator
MGLEADYQLLATGHMWTRDIDSFGSNSYAYGMEVHLSAEKEALLREVATRTGKDAGQLVEEAVDHMLEYDVRFIEAVEDGRTSARRGELIEHGDVVERIERMFSS